MLIGSIELTSIPDAVGLLGELEELYPGVPAEAWEPYRRLYPDLFAGSQWRLPVSCYVVRAGGTTILVDTGVGPPGLWDWQAEHEGELPIVLEREGVRPDAIDVVFLTHLHIDHIGWNADREGVPLFDRARYLVSPEAHAFARDRAELPHIRRCVVSLGDRLEQLDGDTELAPGVTTYGLPRALPWAHGPSDRLGRGRGGAHRGHRRPSGAARPARVGVRLRCRPRPIGGDEEGARAGARRPRPPGRLRALSERRNRASRDGRRARRLGARMTWPRDDAKLERVRSLMADQELDALVVRAPDNVLYLTNFWGMKGFDAVVFPREGEPVADLPRGVGRRRRRAPPGRPTFASSPATRPTIRGRRRRGRSTSSWPRPPSTERSGSSSRSARRRPTAWSGEPTTYSKAWFDAFPDAVDATLLLAEARAIKTPQELERMRLANEIAAAAMDHVQGVIRPGQTEAQIAAEWEGFVHGEGTGWQGKVELALGFSLVWSGPGIKTFTATGDSSSRRGGADAVRDLGLRRRLLVRPHEEPLSRGARAALRGARAGVARDLRRGRRARDRRRRAWPRSTARSASARPRRATRASPRTRSATAWAPARTSRRTRTRPGGGEAKAGMVLAIEPGIYWEGGGGLRLEDNWLVTDGAPEKLSPFPDGIVRREGASDNL